MPDATVKMRVKHNVEDRYGLSSHNGHIDDPSGSIIGMKNPVEKDLSFTSL
jgi:hypothetical protein